MRTNFHPDAFPGCPGLNDLGGCQPPDRQNMPVGATQLESDVLGVDVNNLAELSAFGTEHRLILL